MMHTYKPARFRRLLAWGLDWMLCWLFPFGTVMLLDLLGITPTYLIFPLVLGSFAGFLCRDWLLGGRSVGKRILGLPVMDRQTGAPLTGGKLVLRNLFLFIYPVDGGFLLFSGRSLGERATDTAVARARQRCEVRAKPFLIVTAIVLAISLPISGLVHFLMNYLQDTESYQVCRSYLVQSEAFAAQGADEADIAMNGFSRRTELLPEGPETICTYTFRVQGTTYTVTCHPSGESWAVCTECTQFD